MSKNSIPTDDDFARASAALRQRSEGLEDVRKRVLAKFSSDGTIHEFFILDSSANSFRAYVFFKKESQIELARQSGLIHDIEEAVFRELQRVGRGARDEASVEFEFDSHENVEKNYEGNYFNRLH